MGSSTQSPSKAEILSALSCALDLVEGQPEGHALRTSLLADRLASALGLGRESRRDLFFAGLLKDCGCSNNSVRIHKLFGGDELLSKQRVKFIDWTNPLESVIFAIQNTEREGSVGEKLRRLVANIGTPGQVMKEVTEARCARGAQIALKLGFSQTTAGAVRDLDEHWDGKGAPRGLAGEAVSIEARILGLAQTAEVFFTAYGYSAMHTMVESRTGRWFDPAIAHALLSIPEQDPFWPTLSGTQHAIHIPQELEFDDDASDHDVDLICEAFAEIIDAKSAFTGEHSTRVMQYAVEMGTDFGFHPSRLETLRRAALLHDIGKLGISNQILEKPGKLEDEEFDRMKQHARFTHLILSKVPGFHRITDVASAHHEKLNGRGYWRGLTAEQLDLDMRILAVADIFDALSAKRPYRDALPHKKVFEILEQEAAEAIDPDCVSILKSRYLGSSEFRAAA